MVYNYLGYITGIFSLIMVLLIPYLLLQYNEDITYVTLNGLMYFRIPILLYMIFIGLFFRHDKKLVPMLLPFLIIYSTLRIIVLSYIYLLSDWKRFENQIRFPDY